MIRWLVCLSLAGCGVQSTGTDDGGGGAGSGCEDLSDCGAGFACVEGACVAACILDLDCTGANEICQDGRCITNVAPECTADADCTSPAACERAAGATCVDQACVYPSAPEASSCDDDDRCTVDDVCDAAGQCAGTATICTAPPEPTCSADDLTYQTHASNGTCSTVTGQCDYVAVDVPCADCSTSCLGACDDIVCDDTRGGCQTGGVCLPGTPPTCEYDLAPNDTACDLPSAPVGSLAGICDQGNCVECAGPEDCTTPPSSYAVCFLASCQDETCGYDVQPATFCAPQSCTDATVTFARVCGPEGDCDDAGGEDCAGYACDAAGTACRTTCATDAHCVNGLFCDLGASTCGGFKPDGQSCGSDGECENTCIDGTCGPLAGTGGRCDSSPDCATGHTCDNFICLKLPGVSCATNDECVDVCITGACATQATTGQTCDENPDCVTGHLCTFVGPSGTCKRIQGETCSNGSECDSGFCVNSYCCVEACSDPCEDCGPSGSCNVMPTDDAACNTIPCSDLDTACRSYDDLTSDRCATLAQCKSATVGHCTSYTDEGSGVLCRAATDTCDLPAYCDGSGPSCPANAYRPAGEECRPSAGQCDVAENCTGTSAACPTNGFVSSSVQCRASSGGPCDVAENCTGSSANCPADGFAGSSVQCRAASGLPCDVADYCNGTSAACPADGVASAGLQCRAASGGVCDVAESCDGTNATCPADGYAGSSTICRTDGGYCDVAETCTGSSATCPADSFAWTSGHNCNAGALVGTALTIATGRQNVTAADLATCRAHCDATAGVHCCYILGWELCIKECTQSVLCYAMDTAGHIAWTGTGTTYATNCP